MERGIINLNMNYITHAQNNEKIDPKELQLAIKLLKKDVFLAEMVRISIMLSHSQKEALLQEATRALSLNQTIDRLRVTRTEV